MVARLRTNVLKREEKGFGPVSFPRVLMAGLAGTFATLAMGRVLGFVASCGLGFFVTVLVVVMTQPVQGTPMAQYIIKIFQGMVVIRAIKEKDGDEDKSLSGLTDLLVSVTRASIDDGILKCDEIFNIQAELSDEGGSPATDLVFFSDISDLGSQGLQVVENPFNM